MIVDVVDDTALLSESLTVIAAESGASFTMGTVSRDWSSFIQNWDFDSDLVLFRAELRDHVPAVLKVRALKRLHVASVVVLSHHSPAHEARLIEAGVRALVGRSTSLHELVGLLSSPDDSTRVTGLLPSGLAPVRMSDRELQIACLYSGRSAPSTGALATLLGLSAETVRVHLARARKRLASCGLDGTTRLLLRETLIREGWLFESI